jgi:hypothetical protein
MRIYRPVKSAADRGFSPTYLPIDARAKHVPQRRYNLPTATLSRMKRGPPDTYKVRTRERDGSVNSWGGGNPRV